MNWFRKPTIDEHHLAYKFMTEIMHGVQENWGTIVAEIRPTPLPPTKKLDGQRPQFYFGLAVTAVGVQALPNLFSPDQALRLHAHVFAMAGTAGETGNVAVRVLKSCEEAWTRPATASERPWTNVAGVLFDLLDLDDIIELPGGRYKNPHVLMAMGIAVMTFEGGWWKNAAAQYRVVPSKW